MFVTEVRTKKNRLRCHAPLSFESSDATMQILSAFNRWLFFYVFESLFDGLNDACQNWRRVTIEHSHILKSSVLERKWTILPQIMFVEFNKFQKYVTKHYILYTNTQPKDLFIFVHSSLSLFIHDFLTHFILPVYCTVVHHYLAFSVLCRIRL